MMPLMADNLLESIRLLANVSRLLARRCIAGLEVRRERYRQLVEQSLALTTALVPRLGYDQAARLARLAYEENRTIREIVGRETDLNPEEIDRLLDPARMTQGGLEASGAGA